ncbi:MAG: efflux transporter outer membrane subunit [Sphingomonas bacterium]
MRKPRLALLLAAAGALAGCSMAPAYHVPVTVTPPAFKEAGPWIAATPGDPALAGQWWTLYGDSKLDDLEAQIEHGNPTLAEALARYDEARADLRLARSALFPSIGLSGEATDNRQSDNRPLRGSNQPDLYPADTLGGQFAFELDLWGRVRNNVAAGRATAEASADDLAAIRLSLESRLALTYIALRGYDAQAALLSAAADTYQKADDMTRRRFNGGIASGLDTGRSGAQLAEAKAQLADVAAARARCEHAIASLIGTPASSFSVAPADNPLALPSIPVGLPSTLLQRRPDVAAAERRMAAANARIGVAKAAFFPAIGLGGSGGFQNTGLAGLIGAPNIFWSIGPGAVLNLFEGGRRHAELAAEKARWDQATAEYRRHVLNAFQEVEDGLSQLHHLGDESTAEAQAVRMARQAEQISMNRYVGGAVDYLDVVTAQTTALRTRRTALDLRTRELEASVALIEATGGGWRAHPDAAAGA